VLIIDFGPRPGCRQSMVGAPEDPRGRCREKSGYKWDVIMRRGTQGAVRNRVAIGGDYLIRLRLDFGEVRTYWKGFLQPRFLNKEIWSEIACVRRWAGKEYFGIGRGYREWRAFCLRC
jgi:hypothetical protein